MPQILASKGIRSRLFIFNWIHLYMTCNYRILPRPQVYQQAAGVIFAAIGVDSRITAGVLLAAHGFLNFDNSLIRTEVIAI